MGCEPNDYFTKYRTTTGLILDRASDPLRCSTAAAGFSLAVEALRCRSHQQSQHESLDRINQTLDTLTRLNPPANRGWLYHFTNPTGEPYPGSEVSTIDTAILYAGARRANDILNDQHLEKKIDNLLGNIDLDWMIANSPSKRYVCHGLYRNSFIPCEWDDLNEGVLLYKLFNQPFTPRRQEYHLPLFVYYYPVAFFPRDTDFRANLEKAKEVHLEKYGHMVTATDTENGYEALPVHHRSPLIEAALGLPTPYPTIHSLNTLTGWHSTDRIGIEEGAAILLCDLS